MKRNIFLLITTFFFCLPTATFAKENGFVSLFNGSAQYEGRNADKDMVGSLFMVRLFDDYNFYLGATTLAGFDSFTNNISQERKNGDTAKITINSSFQHRAYGTILGYVYSTESFLGWQFWGGAGYMNNFVDIEGQIQEIVTDSSGAIYRCSGTTNATSTKVNSVPIFFGTGITVYDFGIFIQTMRQNLDDIEITQSGTVTCNRGNTTDSHEISNTRNIAVSFTSFQTGIQYRF